MSTTPTPAEQAPAAESPAGPAELERGLGFTESRITYLDDTVETVHPDSPQIVFLAKRLHLERLDEEYGDDGLMSGFVMLWLAAGKPGANGNVGELGHEKMLELVDAWLGKTKTIERERPSDPPPNRATRRSRRK